ncbi:hypothetical protein GW17_00025190 [Ensete ventricosum]|nr:hypothetical protein GW17_00025190 [Ensete ventricosum]
MHVMLLLRFSNSDIRAKVFVRKIDFKLHVMRLNRIEPFCAFLLQFCIIRSKEGWLAMARPPAGVAGHDQAACRGSRLRPGLLQGRPNVASPQRATANKHSSSPLGLLPAVNDLFQLKMTYANSILSLFLLNPKRLIPANTTWLLVNFF